MKSCGWYGSRPRSPPQNITLTSLPNARPRSSTCSTARPPRKRWCERATTSWSAASSTAATVVSERSETAQASRECIRVRRQHQRGDAESKRFEIRRPQRRWRDTRSLRGDGEGDCACRVDRGDEEDDDEHHSHREIFAAQAGAKLGDGLLSGRATPGARLHRSADQAR